MDQDFKKPFNDISALLPQRLANVFSEGFFQNLHNKMLSRDESNSLYGYIGTVSGQGEYIDQPNLMREINALSPALYARLNQDDRIFTFEDFLDRMTVLGVDTAEFADWGALQSYNLSFPINLDKFVNFHKYRWFGHLLPRFDPSEDSDLAQELDIEAGLFYQNQPEKIWTIRHNLGDNPLIRTYIPSTLGEYEQIIPATITYTADKNTTTIEFDFPRSGIARFVDRSGAQFAPVTPPDFNRELEPEYILMERTTALSKRNDFNRFNFWIHEDDLNGFGLNPNETIQAIAPIIEFSSDLELNNHFADGKPANEQTPNALFYNQAKTRLNQAPLFNIYYPDGRFADQVTNLLTYATEQTEPVHPALKSRVVLDGNGDFLMRQGLTSTNNQEILAVKVGSDLRLLWQKGPVVRPEFLKKDVDGNLVAGDPINDRTTGSWKFPAAWFHNIGHENRQLIPYADLFTHFSSIIAAQPNLKGAPFGSNNLRFKPELDMGLGGTIKEFDGSFGHFLGFSSLPNTSFASIVEFAAHEYDVILTSVKDFIEQNIGQILTDDILVPSALSDHRNKDTVALYERFLSKSVAHRVTASAFIDSNSALKNFPATLPYLGLADAVQPRFEENKNTFGTDLVHHDGHRSQIVEADPILLQQIANTKFIRFDGLDTPGSIGPRPPRRPYKNEFWYNTDANELLMFAVVADHPTGLNGRMEDGAYYYARENDMLFIIKDGDLVEEANRAEPWTIVRPHIIINDIRFLIEEALFDGAPAIPQKLDYNQAQNRFSASLDVELEKEFLANTARRNVNPFRSDYNPDDPFTWNYRQFTIDGLEGRFARWHQLYQAFFGTARPDLEPWALQGHKRKPDFWDETYPFNEGIWPIQMWQDIVNDTTPGHPAPTGAWDQVLAVNVHTNELLPPYVAIGQTASQEALTNDIPARIDAEYIFGDLGPEELAWRQSLEFNYHRLVSLFRLDPIATFETCWGTTQITHAEGFEFDRRLGRKASHKEIALHGQPNQIHNEPIISDLDINRRSNSKRWIITCIGHSPTGSVLQLANDKKDILGVFKADNTAFSSRDLNISVSDQERDLAIGDQIIIARNGDTTFQPAETVRVNGISQWFTQSLRSSAIDLETAQIIAGLSEWEPRLSYLTSGLFDTQSLDIRSDAFTSHEDDFDIILKHNKRQQSFWMSALRVQTLTKGSIDTQPDGQQIPTNKGDDWIFSLAPVNPVNQVFDIYEFDEDSNRQSFRILNGARTSETFTRPTQKAQRVTLRGPQIIVGLQNLVDVIFGYVAALDEDGWRFSVDSARANREESTGRTITWQLEVERLISRQYEGIDEGTGYQLNPFLNRVWFETPQGMVSSFNAESLDTPATSPAILDIDGKPINMRESGRLYRRDQLTEIESRIPMVSIHLFLDSFEHALLFKNIGSDGLKPHLYYDPFLGVRVNRLLLNGRQLNNGRGRLSFGGHFLSNGAITPNIDAHIERGETLYDRQHLLENDLASNAALKTVGYRSQPGLDTLGLSTSAQFQFWQGLIHNKGTNKSIDAYLNSNRFNSALTSEYWAYKIAEYGSAHDPSFPEIRVNANDIPQSHLRLNFLEDGESSQPSFINISPLDTERWFRIEDYNTRLHFNADPIDQCCYETEEDALIVELNDGTTRTYCDLVTAIATPYNGLPAPALDVEHLPQEMNFPDTPDEGQTVAILESDQITPGAWTFQSATGWTKLPAFKQLNSETVHLFPADERTKFEITCYGPAKSEYDPAQLIDFTNPAIQADIPLWDPARGRHSSIALTHIDLQSEKDPAQYNNSLHIAGNPHLTPLRPWGEEQTGFVWWDTHNLEYLPYNDHRRITELDSRLSKWGKLADFASIDLFEWTKSPVPPDQWSDYVTEQQGNTQIGERRPSGRASRQSLFSRRRTWFERAIAWKFTPNPTRESHKFHAEIGAPLFIRNQPDGTANLLLVDRNWRNIDGAEGDHLSAVVGSDVSGDLELLDETFIVIGSQEISFTARFNLAAIDVPGFTNPTTPLRDFNIKITDEGLVDAGPIRFAAEKQDDEWSIRITYTRTAKTQSVLLPDSGVLADNQILLSFDELGLDYSAVTTFNHSDMDFAEQGNRLQAMALAMGHADHDIVLYSARDALIHVDFLPNNINIGQLNDSTVQLTDFVIWKMPTDIGNDLSPPHNIYEPVFGAFQQIDLTPQKVRRITDQLDNPTLLTTGEEVLNYRQEFGPWKAEADRRVDAVYKGEMSFLQTALEPDVSIFEDDRTRVYINGQQVAQTDLILSNDILNFTNTIDLKHGDRVTLIEKAITPTDEELAFDPDIEEDPARLVQYRRDWEYSVATTFTDSGIETTDYYFWVSHKAFPTLNGSLSLLDVVQALTEHPGPFGLFQNIKMQDTARALQVRYTQYIAAGVRQVLTRNNQFKLRFTRDFTLRDQIEDLRLKNRHSEWVLFHEQQNHRIPEPLWRKLVDSVAGEDPIGNPLPAPSRVNYDRQFGTNVRFGLGHDQVMLSRDQAIQATQMALHEITVGALTNSDTQISNKIEGVDLGILSELLGSPTTARQTLDQIWLRARPDQINHIFFTVFHQSLGNRGQFEDLIKTSYLTARTVKNFSSMRQEAPVNGQ